MRLLLLAYLAVHGPAPRAEINELFASPSDPTEPVDPAKLSKQRAKNLTTAFQQIRHEAGDAVFARTQGTVQVSLPCDAVDFEAAVAAGDLATAARLYTGPFLHDIERVGHMRPERWDPELAGWVRETRLRIASRAIGVLAHLGQMQARLGEIGKATALGKRAFETFAATVEFDEYGPGRSRFSLDDLKVLHALLALEASLDLERFRELAGVYVDLQLPSDDEAIERYIKASEWTEVPSPGPVIGRGSDTQRVMSALDRSRGQFVTITGPGGVGKTTLALHVARMRHAEGRYPGGIYFVPLDGLRIPNLVPVRLATALGVDLNVHGDALDQVVQHVRARRALVVLDNYEHLLERADVPRRLVSGDSQLDVIVTSRERLGSGEELVCPISGLAVEPATGLQGEAEKGDAVAWFVRAARGRLPDAEFNEEDLAVIARLCAYLDGHPLAIRLAAQLVDVMPLVDIESRIRADTEVLDSVAGETTDRPKTLQATWESSWDALDPGDHLPLSSLAVFRGGFAWDAVVQVAKADFTQLRRWVDRSLVQLVRGRRLDIHPTLRPLLLAKLRALDPAHTVTLRHTEYFLHAAEENAAQLNGKFARSALGFFESEQANLQAAWEHDASASSLLRFSRVLLTAQSRLGDIEGRLALLARAREANKEVGDTAATVELTNGIADILLQRGEIDAAQSELSLALALSREEGLETVTAETLSQLGGVHYLRREYEPAVERFEEARSLHERNGDRAQAAAELSNIAAVHYQRGDVESAVRIWHDALTGHRRAGDRERQALALNNLGAAYQRLGEFERATVSLEKAKALFGSLGDELGADAANVNIGNVAFLRGYYAESRLINLESLQVHRGMNDEPGEALALTNLAMLDERQGAVDAARSTLSQALSLQENTDERIDRVATLYNLSTVTLQLGDVMRAVALAIEAIELARETGHVLGEGYAHMFHGDALVATVGAEADALQAYERASQCFEMAPDFVGSLSVEFRLGRMQAITGGTSEGADSVASVVEKAVRHDLLPLAVEAATTLAEVVDSHHQAAARAHVTDLSERLRQRAAPRRGRERDGT